MTHTFGKIDIVNHYANTTDCHSRGSEVIALSAGGFIHIIDSLTVRSHIAQPCRFCPLDKTFTLMTLTGRTSGSANKACGALNASHHRRREINEATPVQCARTRAWESEGTKRQGLQSRVKRKSRYPFARKRSGKKMAPLLEVQDPNGPRSGKADWAHFQNWPM
jgi:hypothetical protein